LYVIIFNQEENTSVSVLEPILPLRVEMRLDLIFPVLNTIVKRAVVPCQSFEPILGVQMQVFQPRLPTSTVGALSAQWSGRTRQFFITMAIRVTRQ
uniref:SMP-LTD domain-containing protein n=1 Tax=Echinostoma caproni TaxID=27848 RepID=A0A183APT1_9TREM